MFRAVGFLAIFIAASPASAQFRIEESPEALRKIEGSMAIEDLAVHEKGIISFAPLCSVDGVLFMDGSARLQEKASDYGTSFRVQRLQGNKLAMETMRGSKVTDPQGKVFAGLLERALRATCDNARVPEDRRFAVESIDGQTRSSELLRSR